MFKSTNKPIVLRIKSYIKLRDKTKKTIYRNRKARYLSTHKGSEEERGYFWEEKTKTLGYSFKKLTKSLIDGNRLIKRL